MKFNYSQKKTYTYYYILNNMLYIFEKQSFFCFSRKNHNLRLCLCCLLQQLIPSISIRNFINVYYNECGSMSMSYYLSTTKHRIRYCRFPALFPFVRFFAVAKWRWHAHSDLALDHVDGRRIVNLFAMLTKQNGKWGTWSGRQ